jgi:diguanylate cyclase (GGDEF)-like protein
MVSPPGLLSQTIDAYIGWFAAWHQLVFLQSKGLEAAELEPPSTFQTWRRSAVQADQLAVAKLTVLQEQLHTLARLVLMKTPQGHVINRADYESVTGKYQEFMQALRRLERAFAVAASSLDTLTGLRSRMGLADDLAREHNRFQRTGRPYCLVLMDIDHFKKINDTYGHDAGDKVLASVADHVSRDLRSFDDAYRWGGEEFLLCLKEADAAIGNAVLERLRHRIAEKPIVLADGTAISVTASFGFGVSTLSVTPDELVRAADEALYRAKHGGRNRVEMAHPVATTTAKSKVTGV